MVKVEMQEDEKSGVLAFAFESSNGSKDDLNVIDNLRVAIMGQHPKRGGYINSNRLVIEVNPGGGGI
jgi:hypothetical protein